MKTAMNHPTLGLITYEESFWLGKRTITINGQLLVKKDKKTYYYADAEQTRTVTVLGNFVSGVRLLIDGETIPVTSKAKWYEIALPIISGVLIMIWGNIPQLCAILPLVGGAIGGAINGVMVVSSILVMKSVSKLSAKLLIWLLMTVATVLVCFFVAAFILVALY